LTVFLFGKKLYNNESFISVGEVGHMDHMMSFDSVKDQRTY